MKWVILIGGGYGGFLFDGTEAEAEEMRAHKANWEHARGKKRPADKIEIATGKVSHCANHPGFNNKYFYADCDCPNENCVIEAQDRMEQTK